MHHDLIGRGYEIPIQSTQGAQSFKEFLGLTDINNILIEERLFFQVDNELVEQGRLIRKLMENFDKNLPAGNRLY